MTAEETYQKEYSENMELIEVLKIKLIRHKELQGKRSTQWGDVGDLLHVKCQLDELIKLFY